MGIAFGVLTLTWIVLQRESLSFSWLCAGLALASAFYIVLTNLSREKEIPQQVVDDKMQQKLDEAENRASQTIDGLNREIQKLQQKAIRSEERCLSYQKLVEVHQQEIEKLRLENHTALEQVIQKERKLNELYLAKMEPDLFDTERRDLKKQLHETKSELAEFVKKKKKNSTPASESRDLLGL